MADPLVGTVLDGRYQVDRPLARGGMSTVYAGTDLRLDRRVAVKVMAPALAHDPAFTDRFVREARTAARLSHANAVAVFDQGAEDTAAGRVVFLVMELVPGSTLRDVLRRARPAAPGRGGLAAGAGAGRAGRRAPGRAGAPGRQAGKRAASTDGTVKVVDFGLARAVAAPSTSTQAGRGARHGRVRGAGAGHPRRRRPAHRRLLGRHPALRAAHRHARRTRATRPSRWRTGTSTTTCRRRPAGCPASRPRWTSWCSGPPGGSPAPARPTPARCWPSWPWSAPTSGCAASRRPTSPRPRPPRAARSRPPGAPRPRDPRLVARARPAHRGGRPGRPPGPAHRRAARRTGCPPARPARRPGPAGPARPTGRPSAAAPPPGLARPAHACSP